MLYQGAEMIVFTLNHFEVVHFPTSTNIQVKRDGVSARQVGFHYGFLVML